MAVAIVMDFTGGTLEQYDQVLEKMKLSPGGPGPVGAISHWVTATDKGILITDIWQSREQFDAFAQEQIGPFSAEVGLTAPETTYYDVHSFMTEGPSA